MRCSHGGAMPLPLRPAPRTRTKLWALLPLLMADVSAATTAADPDQAFMAEYVATYGREAQVRQPPPLPLRCPPARVARAAPLCQAVLADTVDVFARLPRNWASGTPRRRDAG